MKDEWQRRGAPLFIIHYSSFILALQRLAKQKSAPNRGAEELFFYGAGKRMQVEFTVVFLTSSLRRLCAAEPKKRVLEVRERTETIRRVRNERLARETSAARNPAFR